MWTILLPLFIATLVCAAPAPSQSSSALVAQSTVLYASDDPNPILWGPDTSSIPQAIRGSLGATILGPQDVSLDKQNPDLLAPPSTDSGSVGNAKWPFSLSHNRLQTGGWARQQNEDVMPMATAMSGVNMRLEAGAIRELHWHKTSEASWAYILKGSVQISAVNSDGQNYVATINEGDLWYFPAGVPHSLQATDALPDGAEFLLVFGTGDFSEDTTFLVTDWMAHVPKEVLAKNFQADISAFDHIPGQELYIFPAALPQPDSDAPISPQGNVPEPFTFKFSQVQPTQLSGGSVKVVDSTTFKIATGIAAAEVTINPENYIGTLRKMNGAFTSEIHAPTTTRRVMLDMYRRHTAHYVENTGNTTLRFLEIFNTDRFQDISLNQWLALTPPDMVKATLNLDDETIARLSKTKNTVVGPA
ncbi:hypothetical protein EW026_g6588 [Hermanssonia centrifuga]|uniref:Cupin type-1 domain-containing protein n=1 Tax=Hermanssonia centrifuga TaxID=98765 RepID=A0A4V3X9P7_9APHY|nr:hypothetical protein EW026_g6588 [Hermanssonia centrifuga]